MLLLTFEETDFITPKSPKGDFWAVVFLKLALGSRGGGSRIVVKILDKLCVASCCCFIKINREEGLLSTF